ncbi:MAG: hypothetical protein IPK82_38840 [Polyangiaceae bacterium]|nr:hypothetical protein [Polyangiaceae bacterium]
MRRFAGLLLSLFPALGCATLADAATGDKDLPNAGAGPFRELKKGELGLSLVTPNAADDTKTLSRDASVIDLDGDLTTFAVAGYFAASPNGAEVGEPTVEIRRTVAEDGRSFDRDRDVVLTAGEAWEQGLLGGPSALWVGGEVWLYYAAGGGIGLAKSADGAAFTKVAGPVLGASESGWDTGSIPRSPSVVMLPKGGFLMFYETLNGEGRSVIGEATSSDGLVWERVGDGPAIAPSEAGEEVFDDLGVGGPAVTLGETALGRRVVRVYYGARTQGSEGEEKRTIGLAARFDGEPFSKATSAVFGATSSRGPSEPAVISFGEFTLIFATQNRSNTDESPAVAAGVAPAQAELPEPTQSE